MYKTDWFDLFILTSSFLSIMLHQSCHGILDISLASVERLHRHNIYPIVLLLKFRHHKQIREVCESHHPPAERISQKEAKEMFELAAKMEQEYKNVISGKCWDSLLLQCISCDSENLISSAVVTSENSDWECFHIYMWMVSIKYLWPFVVCKRGV